MVRELYPHEIDDIANRQLITEDELEGLVFLARQTLELQNEVDDLKAEIEDLIDNA